VLQSDEVEEVVHEDTLAAARSLVRATL